jgi:hypothetical protein
MNWIGKGEKSQAYVFTVPCLDEFPEHVLCITSYCPFDKENAVSKKNK